MTPPGPSSFAELAGTADPPLDAVCLALAAEFRTVDRTAALAALDGFGAELALRIAATDGTPDQEAAACRELLGETHGFAGDAERYDDPGNSMLDVVLERRRGLPILLSAVYVEAARRAGVALEGVGLPGHFVVGHFGAQPPLLLDPFNGGAAVVTDAPPELVRPWRPLEIALRMLNNLVPAFERRGNLAGALHAARLRLVLPTGPALRDELRAELSLLEARLN